MIEKEFQDIEKDLVELCKKHNIEIIIKSELSFKKLDGQSDSKTKTKKGSQGSN